MGILHNERRFSLFATGALVALVVALTLGPPGRGWRFAAGALAVVLALEPWRRRPEAEPPQQIEPSRLESAGGARPLSLLSTGLYDPLTRLPNRTLLNELLDKQVSQANRSGYRLGVAVLDIDRFRSLNDSLGQTAGDRLLVQLAQRFQAQIRQSDTLARTGGDGFTLLVARVEHPDDVELAARRVLATLAEPFAVAGREVRVTASVGSSVFPDDTLEPALLLSFAEEALARVKEEGGAGLTRYGPTMARDTRDRATLEQELLRVVGERGLTVHYQPQVALEDGRLIGMEALVRWEHPERGLLTAGRFVPLAERTGAMGALGQWLLEEICRQTASWRRRGLAVVPVSVNVSIRQFQSGDVAAQVGAALESAELEPELLQLEITESIALHDSELIADALRRIQELGVKIHLDDFGTGYSSLSYLLRYPVDVIKIDRSFIEGVQEGQDGAHDGAKIVRLTIALARSLGLELIAEGVENSAQLEFLRRNGCPAAQGYLFGRPMPPDDMEALLARGAVEPISS